MLKIRSFLTVIPPLRRNRETDEVFMREKYESLSAAVLKELAKARGIKSVSAMKKSQVIEAMLAEDAREQQEKAGREQEEKQESKE